MRQSSLSTSGFEKYRKKTRKQQFLEEMEIIVPWRELAAAIEPYYPKPEGAGRRPVGIERMLRIHLLQHWFNPAKLPQKVPQNAKLVRRFIKSLMN